MVGDHAGHHGLADGNSPYADAWVVAAFGDDLGFVAVAVHGLARRKDRGRGFHREACRNGLGGRTAAEDYGRGVREEAAHAVVAYGRLVVVFLAGESGGCEARTELNAFDSVYAHESRCKVAVELAVDRRAEARRHTFGHDFDDRADGGAGYPDAFEIGLPLARDLRVGVEDRVFVVMFSVR